MSRAPLGYKDHDVAPYTAATFEWSELRSIGRTAPRGEPLLVVANEVSGTVTLYGMAERAD